MAVTSQVSSFRTRQRQNAGTSTPRGTPNAAQVRRAIALHQRFAEVIKQEQSICITDESLGIPGGVNSLISVLRGASVKIEQPTLHRSKAVVSVAGKVSLLGLTDVSVTATFSPQRSNFITQLRLERPEAPIAISDLTGRLFSSSFEPPAILAAVKFSTVTLISDDDTTVLHGVTSEDFSLCDGKLVCTSATITLARAASKNSKSVQATVVAKAVVGGVRCTLSGELSSVPTRPTALRLVPLNKPMDAKVLLEHFLGAPLPLPHLALSTLSIRLNAKNGHFDVEGQLNGTWSARFGKVQLTLRPTLLQLAKTSSKIVVGSVGGKVRIAGKLVDFTGLLDGQVIISGKLPSMPLGDLTGALGLATLENWGPSKKAKISAIAFQLTQSDSSNSLYFRFGTQKFGTGFLVLRVNSQVQSLLGFAMPSKWRFANLSAALKSWDSAMPHLSRAALIVSTFDDDTFRLPGAETSLFVEGVRCGTTISADLKLKGPVLSTLGRLLDRPTMPVKVAMGSGPKDCVATASFSKSMPVLPGIVVLENVNIAITSDRAIKFTGQARMLLDGVPALSADAMMNGATKSLTFATLEPWERPFGIKQLTINKVALQYSLGSVPTYALYGELSIGSKPLQAFVQLTGSVPTALSFKYDGKLSLLQLVDDLVGLDLPAALPDLGLSDFSVYVVGPPGATINTVSETLRLSPGLSVNGTFNLLGLSGSLRVAIDPANGICAKGAFNGPISIGNIIRISGNTAKDPPSVEIDTRRDVNGTPFVRIDGRLALLGVEGSVKGGATSAGLDFELSGKGGGLKYRLHGLSKGPFNAWVNGSFDFEISESIELKRGKFKLGTISAKVQLSAAFNLAITEQKVKTTVVAQLKCSQMRLPDVSFSIDSAASLAEIQRQLAKKVLNSLNVAVSDLAADVTKFLHAFKHKLLKINGRLEGVLRDGFKQTDEQIAKAFRDTLGQGAAGAADALKRLGLPPEQTAAVLTSLGEPPAKLKRILEEAGYSPASIGKAISKYLPPPIRVPPPIEIDPRRWRL
jgi:hypothetical protein